MRIGPFEITRRKASGMELVTQWPLTSGVGASFSPWLRESFGGAWQRNIVTPVEDALTHPTFWSCVTLIAGDIAKMRLKLIEEDEATDICQEVDVPAFSPIIRKPNHYQNRIQFYSYWAISMLTRGNAYVLKARDGRNVVTDMYLLDPTRCRPAISPAGDIFYALGQDLLNGVTEESTMVPAREIIHDRMNTLYHPLVGMSPVFASGHAAYQALQTISNSTRLAKNGFQLGGIVTAPGRISEEQASRLEKLWNDSYAGDQNTGKIAAIGDGLKFEQLKVMSAVDAQIIDQLKWDDEKICSTFHVPAYMVGVGAPPAYNNIEALSQQYYSQCLQILIESIELCLEEGLALDPYEVEFDLDGLLRMDTATKIKAAVDSVRGGLETPNEARAQFNRDPIDGGDTVYLQEQDHSLQWLSKRDSMPIVAPTAPTAPAPAVPAPTKAIEDVEFDGAELLDAVLKELKVA
jgi:HK97 family phage portal protein